MCTQAYHEREVREGPGSFRVLDALSCYLSLIFNYSDTEWETKNVMRSKFKFWPTFLFHGC